MNEEFAKHIYNLVCGFYLLQRDDSVPESDIVANEFAEGCKCNIAYSRMLNAYTRVCERLGTTEWEDPDVEIIVNSLLEIGEHTSLKMFHYGFLYGSNSKHT